MLLPEALKAMRRQRDRKTVQTAIVSQRILKQKYSELIITKFCIFVTQTSSVDQYQRLDIALWSGALVYLFIYWSISIIHHMLMFSLPVQTMFLYSLYLSHFCHNNIIVLCVFYVCWYVYRINK